MLDFKVEKYLMQCWLMNNEEERQKTTKISKHDIDKFTVEFHIW